MSCMYSEAGRDNRTALIINQVIDRVKDFRRLKPGIDIKQKPLKVPTMLLPGLRT